MAAIICNAGHMILFVPLYYPVNSPIEYVFTTIQGMLRIKLGLNYKYEYPNPRIVNSLSAMDGCDHPLKN
jgi:hypothetical protein